MRLHLLAIALAIETVAVLCMANIVMACMTHIAITEQATGTNVVSIGNSGEPGAHGHTIISLNDVLADDVVRPMPPQLAMPYHACEHPYSKVANGRLVQMMGESSNASPWVDPTETIGANSFYPEGLPPVRAHVASSPLRPDAKLTPGATQPVALKALCTPGYSKTVRNVPEAEHRQAFLRYGMTHPSGKFEVDHLISLELGGTNAIENIWPQSYTTKPWNAHRKDQLENRLHWMVCHGTLTLAVAQHDIATDWVKAYSTYITNGPKKGTR